MVLVQDSALLIRTQVLPQVEEATRFGAVRSSSVRGSREPERVTRTVGARSGEGPARRRWCDSIDDRFLVVSAPRSRGGVLDSVCDGGEEQGSETRIEGVSVRDVLDRAPNKPAGVAKQDLPTLSFSNLEADPI